MNAQKNNATEFNNSSLEILIPADVLQARIAELGAEITRDYAGKKPLLICVLKGAMVFMADLMRATGRYGGPMAWARLAKAQGDRGEKVPQTRGRPCQFP